MSGDYYPSVEALIKTEREGIDYRITSINRGHNTTIVAPHGGGIEPHTSQIAGRIAGEEFNLFLFEGTKPSGNQRLHVTSDRFSHPVLEELLRQSRVVVSVHGKNAETDDDEHVGVGGLNVDLSQAILKELQRAGFEGRVEGNARLGGESPRNFVNRAKEPGAQLELTWPLRKRLMIDDACLSRFAAAIRDAIQGYLGSVPR